MSDEPLYCPFCGAEDFACTCEPLIDLDHDTRQVFFCEICGARLDGPHSDESCKRGVS